MTNAPIMFKFWDLINGQGYIASVVIEGRALLTEEEDGEFWLNGVQPGGIAESGTDPNSACAEFRDGYLSVLYDCAAEVDCFEDFKKEIEGFFQQCGPDAENWTSIVTEARVWRKPISGLIRYRGSKWVPSLTITNVDPKQATPEQNKFPIFREVF